MDVTKDIGAYIPQVFGVADYWAGTVKAFVAKRLPNSPIEALGGI